jgi:hypothetical protein
MLPYTAVDLIRSMTVTATYPDRKAPRNGLRSRLSGLVARQGSTAH